MYRPTAATRQNADERRRTIAEAARALVTESGFASATVKSVAARAGCSAGLLYTYFPNRDALLRSTFAHAAGHELAAVSRAMDAAPSPAAAVAAVVQTFLSRALAGPRLANALLFEGLPQAVEEERLRFRASYAAVVAAHLPTAEAADTAGAEARDQPPSPPDAGPTAEAAAGNETPANDDVTARALVGALSGCLQAPVHDEGRTDFSPAEVNSLITHMTAFCLGAAGLNEPDALASG
jgi:AcrR family transcriptional regulator